MRITHGYAPTYLFLKEAQKIEALSENHPDRSDLMQRWDESASVILQRILAG